MAELVGSVLVPEEALVGLTMKYDVGEKCGVGFFLPLLDAY